MRELERRAFNAPAGLRHRSAQASADAEVTEQLPHQMHLAVILSAAKDLVRTYEESPRARVLTYAAPDTQRGTSGLP
jgi:hypothetical protein